MPDHVGDRGAVRLDPGASRSPTYQPIADDLRARRRCIFMQAGQPLVRLESDNKTPTKAWDSGSAHIPAGRPVRCARGPYRRRNAERADLARSPAGALGDDRTCMIWPDEDGADQRIGRSSRSCEPSQITSRRLVKASPAAARATTYAIRMIPPTHAGGAFGKAGPEVVRTSEASAGAMTGAPSIQPWWKRL